MKKILFFVGLVLLCLFVGSVSAMSGSGTASDPYILTTPADLQALSGTGIVGYGTSSYYELGADIDMSSVANFTPIGTDSYRFAGHFDGNNHTISGFTINNPDMAAGLFSYASTCVISNIIFNNANIVNNAYNTGTLLGYIKYSTNIIVENIHVYNSSIVSTNAGVGGIVGHIEGAISSVIRNCSVENSIITATGNICGGIIGPGNDYMQTVTYNNIIQNCNVINCYIKCNSPYVGGIAGSAGRIFSTSTHPTTTPDVFQIINCNVIKSTIIGTNYIGGIYSDARGGAVNPIVTDCTVSDCSIIGTSNVAGVGN